MFLSKSEFIEYFNRPTKLTIEDFSVKVGKKMYSLKEYMEKKRISLEKTEMVFNHITNRNDYLTRFFSVSLKIQETPKIREIEPMNPNEMNNNKLVNYKNIIRNMFWLDILKNTKSGFENNPSYINVLEELYFNNIIDYKLLTPSAIHYIQKNRIGSVYSSYYFRASIMNPYLVYSIHKSLIQGSRIFTPTLGWASYCYGFLECDEVLEYVGTDVIQTVCEKTAQFAKTNYPNKIVDIYCSPSEDLLANPEFIHKYTEYFDTVFFSPPYYCLEIYEGEQQSTFKYNTYELWLDNYWRKTIELCKLVLKKGGKLCYILSGYGSNSGSYKKMGFYDLLNDMNAITDEFFTKIDTQNLYNKNVFVTQSNHRETAEKIIIYEKVDSYKNSGNYI